MSIQLESPSNKEFKWIDPKQFDLNKFISSKGRVLEVDLEYPKIIRRITQ